MAIMTTAQETTSARSGSFTRRASLTPPALTIDLDIAGLERFLLTTFGYSPHPSLSSVAQQEARDLSRRLRERGSKNCSDELLCLVGILSDLISNHTLAPAVVFRAHYFTGQIHQTQSNYDAAIRSYLRAAWIGNAAKDAVSREMVGRMLHRLALCYARKRCYKKAATLLSTVVEIYAACRIPEKSQVFVAARHLKREYEALDKLSEESESLSSLGPVKTLLPMIDEETENTEDDDDDDACY